MNKEMNYDMKLVKELSKKQKFDLEMIYLPMVSTNNIENAGTQYVYLPQENFEDMIKNNKYDELLSLLFSRYAIEKLETKGLYLQVIKDYEDVIDWKYEFANPNRMANILRPYKRNRNEVIDYLSKYIKRRMWKLATDFIDTKDFDFIRKYKDVLNWKTLSSRIVFTTEFLLEMKDYIDYENLINSSAKNIDKIRSILAIYLKDNLEEIVYNAKID